LNLLILEPNELLADGNYLLQGRKFQHLIEILKVQVGKELEAGALELSLGKIQILEIDLSQKTILVKFLPNSNQTKTSSPKIFLYSAYQRPQTLKKILQLSATVGVSEIHFFPMQKSEKSYENSSLWKNESYKKEFILGLEQGKKIQMPKLFLHKSFHFLQKENILGFKILLDLLGKKIAVYENEIQKADSISIALGPESGLTEADSSFFQNLGFSPCKLSNHVLRSEYALAFALAQLELYF
jgi:RsmE family RNA methyltransferase